MYRTGDVACLDNEEAKLCARIAPDYEVDESGLLFFCPRTAVSAEERTELVRLVVPKFLQRDFLHHFHTSLKRGHQGVGHT